MKKYHFHLGLNRIRQKLVETFLPKISKVKHIWRVTAVRGRKEGRDGENAQWKIHNPRNI